jgi:FkbH-like protein
MTKDVVLLGDKTLSLLARDLNSELRETDSSWNVVDAGYDTWLVSPLDQSSILFRQSTVAWAFVLSPRVLENVPDIADRLGATLDRLRSLPSAPTVLFSNFFADPSGAMPLSNNLERHALAGKLNERLLAFRDEHPWFHVVDQLGLALQHGVTSLHDPRFEAFGQLYFSPAGSHPLSALWLRALRSLERPQKKVCALDLDGTLWGGILGEDGPDGLQMADSGGGFAYRRFQRSLLDLRRSGVLLTACSKNNPEEALSTLQSHPDCLLRPSHFAHLEIGWGLKSEALARTAQKLGLGLDSFVFIDDSPVERAEVQSALPAVEVLDFPADPLQLVSMLSKYPGFDTLRQTDEDRQRAESYLQEAQRTASKDVAASPEEFYRSLGLRLSIFSPGIAQADRLQQLLMKTNQFNLTGERLSAEQFRAMMNAPACMILGLRVSDRFGDSGITGLAIVEMQNPQAWSVRNFLLSCRVIRRTVENAFLAWLVDLARRRGLSAVALRYVATGRNQVAHEFLQTSGGEESQTGDMWSFDTQRPQVLPAHFVQIDDALVV